MNEQDIVQTNTREIVDWHLRQIGVPENTIGYEYLKEAIILTVEQPQMMSFTKEVYPRLAQIFGIKSNSINKRIKNTIEVTFYKKKRDDVVQYYFGNSIDRRKSEPTNSEFIMAVREKIIEQSEPMKLISEHLLEIGIPINTQGYVYLKHAIAIVFEEPKMLERNTMKIYARLAKMFKVEETHVINAIKDTIEFAFEHRVTEEAINKYFGNSLRSTKTKPINIEIIAAIREQIIEETPNMKLAAEHLRVIGVPIYFKGFQYLKKAICIILENEKLLELKDREIFNLIAKDFKTKTDVIKYGMSRAIKRAYESKKNSGVLKRYFGDNLKYRPSVINFVIAVKIQIIKNGV